MFRNNFSCNTNDGRRHRADRPSPNYYVQPRIAHQSIVTDSLVDGCVTDSKIQDSAVTSSKLQDGAVTPSKLGSDLFMTVYDSVYFNLHVDGTGALIHNASGAYNVAIGTNSLAGNTTGEYNIAAGTDSLQNNTTGSNNIAIGRGTGPTITTVSNTVCIGNNATTGIDHSIQLGSNSATLSLSVGNTEVVSAVGVKTFVIDHPQDPDERHLIHACLEGPEAGVYYRGKGEIPTTGNKWAHVVLPSYFSSLVVHGSATIMLTAIIQPGGRVCWPRRLLATDVTDTDGSFYVYGDPGAFHWHVYAQRAHTQFNIEPRKRDVQVKGIAPYTYIHPPPPLSPPSNCLRQNKRE